MLQHRIRPDIAVAVVYVAAMFVNILDSTIVNVTLPTLADEFDVGTGSVEWVVTGYLLSLAVWIPASGWIGDRVGTKRVFLFAILVFTGASALCGMAQSLEELIAFRILQGLGGGMLTPVGFAMLMRAFPPERRAAASKVLMIPTAVAPATGPVLGGFLNDALSWRWVFYVNLPLGIATFIFGLLFLREHREPHAGRFDVAGFVLSAAGLTLILFGLGQGPQHGWGSPSAWLPLVVGVAAFVLLVVVELRIREPLLDLRLLEDRLFRSTMLASVFAIGSFLGFLFIIPLFLQRVLGLSALHSGLTTFPEAVGVLTASQVAGKFYPAVGPRRMMAGGLACMAALLVVLTRLELDTSLWAIRILMYFLGASMAFVFIPLQAAAVARIDTPKLGRASAILNTQRQMAAALGVAVLATVLSLGLAGGAADAAGGAAGKVDAYHTVFLVAALMALAGAVASLFVHDSDAAETMHKKEKVAAEPEPVAPH